MRDELMARFPEINPNNYNHDDVCALNDWGIEVVSFLATQQAEAGELLPILRTYVIEAMAEDICGDDEVANRQVLNRIDAARSAQRAEGG